MAEHNENLPPVRVAFIIDNVVADVLHADYRLAAIFLSNPLVLDITDLEDAYSITPNSEYDPESGKFTPSPTEPTASFPINQEDILDIEE